jgi:hypothetical protein
MSETLKSKLARAVEIVEEGLVEGSLKNRGRACGASAVVLESTVTAALAGLPAEAALMMLDHVRSDLAIRFDRIASGLRDG